MAKESMKAREVKRANLVAKYAEKRAALKAAGDWEALQLLPKKFFTCKNEKQMQINWKTKRIYETIWSLP